MAKAVKVVNYTPEQTSELVNAYKARATDHESGNVVVAEFAEKFGKAAKSIVAKLSREGVYFPKEYKTKQGDKPIKKDETADSIGKILGLSDGEADSLAKANKTALLKILSALSEKELETE
jgi:hypothetical protein